MWGEHLKLEVFCIGSCSCIYFTLTYGGYVFWAGIRSVEQVMILNLANKSVHTLFSIWEICWERGGMKARKEDVELVGKSQRLPDHPPKQRLSCCWHLFPAVLCKTWNPKGAAEGAGGFRWSWISDWISGFVSLPGIHLCKAGVLGPSDSGFPAANKRCCFWRWTLPHCYCESTRRAWASWDGSCSTAGNNPVVFIPRCCFISVSQPEMLYLKAVGVRKREEDLGLKFLAACYVL